MSDIDYWKKNNLVKPEPYVVCAANRHLDTGRIICGARHWDAIMRSQVLPGESRRWEQGFINQFGEFLTRKEAWVIAAKNKQIRRFCYAGQTGTLYSENLY